MILRLGFFALAALLAGSAATQEWARRRDRRRLTPPAAGSLHYRTSGSGSPAVIFEAGLAASSLSWVYIQPPVAAFTTTVAYDRAGLGWSDLSREPRTLRAMVREVTDLLDAQRVFPPFILVGHSFGALVVRAFAYLHPEEVAGIVLIDPVSSRQWCSCSDHDRRRLAVGARLSRRGAWLARFGVVRFALWAATLRRRRLAQSIARATAGPGAALLGRLVGEVRKLPSEVLPVVRAQWSAGKSFRGMAEHLECLPACAAEAALMPFAPPIFMVVLSAGSATPGELSEREEWLAPQVFGRHTQLEGTGHWLHLERPEAVADAIRELVEHYRETAQEKSSGK